MDAQNQITLDTPTPFVTAPEIVTNSLYERGLFERKLSELELESLASGQATLVGPASIISAAQTKLNDLEQLFARVTGRPIRVALRPHEPTAAAEREAPRAPAADHPLVRQAIEQLGARIVAVHPRSRPSGAAQ